MTTLMPPLLRYISVFAEREANIKTIENISFASTSADDILKQEVLDIPNRYFDGDYIEYIPKIFECLYTTADIMLFDIQKVSAKLSYKLQYQGFKAVKGEQEYGVIPFPYFINKGKEIEPITFDIKVDGRTITLSKWYKA